MMYTKPFDGSLVQPIAKRLPWVLFSSIKTMPLDEKTAHQGEWWVASKKSSEQEFFVPAGMHLDVKLLIPSIWGFLMYVLFYRPLRIINSH